MSTSKKKITTKPDRASEDPKKIEYYIKQIGIALDCLQSINTEHNFAIEYALMKASALDYEAYYAGLEMIHDAVLELHKIGFGEEAVNYRIEDLASK